MEKEKKSKEEKKVLKEEKKRMKKASKKKVDKTRLATQIIAGLMAAFMIIGIAATCIYYFLRMMK